MHEDAVNALNNFHHNNEGRDDCSGYIAKQLEDLSSDIKHLDNAVHDAWLAMQVTEELPF
tara:strand:- start:126 stop:305 length:180 start_codon:yes stop_codon:yes gene_type:complete